MYSDQLLWTVACVGYLFLEDAPHQCPPPSRDCDSDLSWSRTLIQTKCDPMYSYMKEDFFSIIFIVSDLHEIEF